MASCAVLQLGVEEILMLAGKKTIEALVEKLFLNPSLEVIALKKGKKGSTIFTRGESFDFGIYPVIQVNPTGAGHAFDAGFLCGLVKGASLKDCA